MKDEFLPATKEDIEIVTKLENALKEYEQKNITTWHTLHEGVYTRTVILEAGEAMTGAFIKIPTTLLINGNARMLLNKKVVEINGFEAIPAPEKRKQFFYAITETTLSMIFKTKAKNIDEAEQEFTDDFKMLMSRNPKAVNIINMKKENQCLEQW